MAKICNINFWIKNDPPPSGTFPKIHPFWMCKASLRMVGKMLYTIHACRSRWDSCISCCIDLSEKRQIGSNIFWPAAAATQNGYFVPLNITRGYFHSAKKKQLFSHGQYKTSIFTRPIYKIYFHSGNILHIFSLGQYKKSTFIRPI